MTETPDAPWHALEASAVATALATDLELGLPEDEAARRLAAGGRNEIERAGGVRPLAILARQFESLVVWILLAAGAVSILLGEHVDGAAILAILVLNAALGFAQELRAERAVVALAKLTAPRARVVRGGRSRILPASEVVRGDLLVLEAGDVVAADARLFDAAALRTNEAPLTGESEPVDKHADLVPASAALADRRNLAFLGTSVAKGAGRALVVATGMQTEVGHIVRLLERASGGDTPLQRRLDKVGRQLVLASLAIVGLVFALGLARGAAPFELFLGAVSLAVAAVPEGLPAVVTVALALSVQRMAGRHALVRSLPAVETLGSTQVICTDKTGTLTVGAMTVRRLVTPGARFRVSGEGYAPAGEILFESGGERLERDELAALVRAGAACNDAELGLRDGAPSIVGDPTEAALLVAAAKAGLTREAIEAAEPRLRSLPFDADRKRMCVVRRRSGAVVAYVKGAPEVVLERCSRVRTGDGVERPLDAAAREAFRRACSELAADGLRILAFAERTLADADAGGADVEADLAFLGLAGLQDPPRPEARDAVARCSRAGIRTVMITGDHRETAAAVARELGILGSADEVVEGAELERLDDGALAARVDRIAVFARTTPEHKLRIVRAWKARGAVVAMTGDGVNDAPALREASIGVAMGISGTEVAKEAADMVITDDDFSSIVAAVEEGRGVFDNVAKTLSYLLAGNAAELALVLGATLLGYPLPLLPIQLLWINLVTDGLPALALATDPIDPAVLARKPLRAETALADRARIRGILLTGCLTAGVALAAFVYESAYGHGLEDARDAAFSTLVFAELFRAFGARSETRLATEVGWLSNPRLLTVVGVSLALQVAIHHSDALRTVFGIRAATAGDYVAWILLASIPAAVLEARKAWRRRRGGEIPSR
jgi:Ca2+-transporting ATPase